MTGFDPYLDLNSGILRNRLSITDPVELATAEAAITAVRLAQLAVHPVTGDHDLTHLQAIHRFVFEPLYDWAGEIRTVTLAKGGQEFCPPELIRPHAAQVFLGLAVRDHLRGLVREQLLTDLTDFLAALNDLHPFREGNGRTQRAFLTQLVQDSGYRLRWAAMSAEENSEASRAAGRGDRKPLHAMLDRLLVRW